MRILKVLSLSVLGSIMLSGCNNSKANNDEYIKKSDIVDPLVLFTKVTELKTAFYQQYGNKVELPENAKQCSAEITKNSNVYDYMDSKDALSYTEDSEYAKDGEATFTALDKLMNEFKDIGFIKAIKNDNKTPALMFDIDNTLQLTSFDDDWFTKADMATPGAINFLKNQCFKDGVDCYFITARYCYTDAANSTEKWLKDNVGLTDEQIDKYVFLSGAIDDNLCATNPNEKVAYKDAFRQALSEQRNVYWLMSVGDQMTDWYGSHSGMKVWYPNQMFHSDIVSNNYTDTSNCTEKTVVAPSEQCYNKLKDGILQNSTIKYCKNFPKNEYYSGK